MDPSLSLEDVYTSYTMEDMKPSPASSSHGAVVASAASSTYKGHAPSMTRHISTPSGSLPTVRVMTSAPPLGRDLFTYDQLAGHFDAAFKCNQALHDLRLSQIKASLARITDLNVLKEHLLICERRNWADEVTTMIVERQIEIMHPAPQRRQVWFGR
ncbi:hypothetical protein B0H14DRAFT_2579368 [Mycena olivaceomarginata]|nr:hypothetical protein B0H14DRAFT_2579368 [Mycena olivaceomarginata]